MKHIFLLIISCFFLYSCNEQELVQEPSPVSNTENLDDDLTEDGSNDLDESEEEITIANACQVFQDDRNDIGDLLVSIFPRFSTNCTSLSQSKTDALLITHSFTYNILDLIDIEENNRCHKFAKRAVRKVYQIDRRENKILSNADNSDLLILRNKLAKERLDRTLRKIFKHECSDDLISSIEASSPSKDKVFDISRNHIINGSFELLKNPHDHIKGTSSLEDGWTIVESSNVPGWKVKAIDNQDQNKKCDYLEFQTSNLVANAPDGRQIIELDGHCTDLNGRRVRGNSQVEIFQRFPVSNSGNYRLKLFAQKRSGRYGSLEFSVHQRRSEKNFVQYDLPNQATWNQVCYEVQVDDINKNVTVSIRDSGGDNRQTYGLLVDDIVFEEGSCN